MNNLDKIKEETKNVTLVAATKYIDSEKMRSLFDFGITNFGENRVDSLLKKKKELSDLNITWHFIGHLQKNKAAKVINEIEYLHSLDSLELAEIIDKKRTTPLKCFVELHLASSNTKYGVKDVNFKRLCLHANKLVIINPLTKKTTTYTASIPTDFKM